MVVVDVPTGGGGVKSPAARRSKAIGPARSASTTGARPEHLEGSWAVTGAEVPANDRPVAVAVPDNVIGAGAVVQLTPGNRVLPPTVISSTDCWTLIGANATVPEVDVVPESPTRNGLRVMVAGPNPGTSPERVNRPSLVLVVRSPVKGS